MVQKNISDAGYMEGNTFLVRLGGFFVCFFFNSVHYTQEWFIPASRKSAKSGKMPAWMNKEPLTELGEAHERWQHGEVTWEDTATLSRACMDGVRKARTNLELNVVRDLKGNKKGF